MTDKAIYSDIDGVIRSILHDNSPVSIGMKISDIDPRGDRDLCPTISYKARSFGGAVMEAVFSQLPKRLTQQ